MFIAHAYTKYPKAPEGRQVNREARKLEREQREVGSVGVGFPNPLGEENSPHDGYRAANCAAFSPKIGTE